MRILFKDAKVINVFTSCVEKKDVLIEDEKIINVGVFKYDLSKIDKVIDCKDKYLAPGFIDGHIHIESSMLLPTELSKLLIKRGTTSAVCDPHEVANVKGLKGIDFMLENAKNALMDLYFMIPSCVPATIFDQNFGPISAKDIKKYYDNPMVLGLAEMMNFVGVINDDEEVLEKINDCLNKNLVVDGHSPLLTGEDLDKYLASGISSDHECTNLNEAIEKLSEGMWIMIREGSAAKNLTDLIDLFDEKYNSRCLLVTDDIEALHLEKNGDIDYIINKATKLGKNPIVGIKMATIQAATRFKLQNVGAICPGYDADIILFDDLNNISVTDCFKRGKHVVENGLVKEIINEKIELENTMNIKSIKLDDFFIEPKSNKCRVIEVIPGEILTNELILDLDFKNSNGIDLKNDVLKIAVFERHHNTGSKCVGFIKGLGLKSGAIASSVSHDSHNVVVVGTNENDMFIAVNHLKENGGGKAIVNNGKIISFIKLNAFGLMSCEGASEVIKQNISLHDALKNITINNDVNPFMNLSFLALPVIPHLKITTNGLVDVFKFEIVDLFV